MTKAQQEGQSLDKLAGIMADIAGHYNDLIQDFLSHQGQAGGTNPDVTGLGRTYLELSASLMQNPGKLFEAQTQAWTAYTNLWLNSAKAMLGEETSPVREPGTGDRRFRHAAWDEHPFFSFIKQSYLVTADAILSAVSDVDDIDQKTAGKAQFYTRQFVDAMSPTNFLLTNPEVLEATLDSKGENLLKGMQNFIDDIDAETGLLRIKMTDEQAFEPGVNIAVTPGKVVFQNDLFQLLQYEPSTGKTFRKPLLIMPPWINKYYVLDLQPQNSMIKWLVEQGHTVFVISWVNPDEKLAHKDFEHYVTEGSVAAIDAVEQATGESGINIVGYCIGGTLLAATLAYLQATGDARVASATFFVSLIDFSIPGDLGVFIDEQQLESLEQTMNERGYHDGKEMAATFNLLRSNDLIWSFYVRNYLLGKDPFPFDLLYWNADSTRLPARMHSTYLRTMYLKNEFREPGGLSVAGTPIDVSTIRVPAYFISTEEDHIAPWEGTYLGAQLLSGPVKFVLGKSGHIAGVINPPDAQKYGYYTGPDVDRPAAEWHDNAELHPGSWWPDWQAWLEQFAGGKIPARTPGGNGRTVIEDAPGSYIKMP
ncbi:MAG: class I poly(R)-hydroxyalkanoic acid synthase [Gammaproteobacteria bacterium]|nr:class I poly(R)-hydroxyalkanoic acid synthase [Gammaproteobacteria bacterium]